MRKSSPDTISGHINKIVPLNLFTLPKILFLLFFTLTCLNKYDIFWLFKQVVRLENLFLETMESQIIKKKGKEERWVSMKTM